ncbi:MAG TPA: hypothetical protein VEA58_07300 [Anaerovoracaceae bacterium]|nr:hypothetical protein [Anaerovoracaceae bacterium]
MIELNAQTVQRVFVDCLFSEAEFKGEGLRAEGVVITAMFNPVKIEGHRHEIESMLNECHPEFFNTEQGGRSFLNLCMDKNGQIWTGDHHMCDCLICLGIAIAKLKLTPERELWQTLPHGLPFIIISK